MIRKLRFKFVMINMSIVTIMLGVILGLVFYFTRANLETESIAMMQNIASQPFHPGIPNESGGEVRLPYFILQVSPRGELIATSGGYYDLSNDAFLSDLIDMAFASPKAFGVIEGYHLRYYRVGTPIDQCLVFTDISSEVATLDHLTKTCLFLGGLGFGVFLAISILLSGWAVRPVELAWKQQRQFVADASHELKTPLTVIMTNAELMSDPEYSEAYKARFLSHILVMSRQMRELIEQLLELARTDNAESRPTVGTVDFSRLAANAVLPFEPAFFEKGLRLDVRIDRDISVSGETALLQRLMDILLDNSLKYSSPGGTAWVTLQKQGNRRCRLVVKNQGERIPPEDIKNIFKRFYRVDRARSRDGSFGLGLSIAENIVVQHRGSIWAESEDGVNSFFVELPCV